jgi:hypothetical protein
MILRKARKHLAVTAGRTSPDLLTRQLNRARAFTPGHSGNRPSYNQGRGIPCLAGGAEGAGGQATRQRDDHSRPRSEGTRIC